MFGKRLFSTLVLMTCLFSWGISQNATLVGKVTDGITKEALPAVKILLDSAAGGLTDSEGNYSIQYKPGIFKVIVVLEGYDSFRKKVTLIEGEETHLNIVMKTPDTELDIVVITGSQYEKKIGEETGTIDVIKPYLIQNTNLTDLSDAVRKVPGVNVTDGQASIRGGSGYSYGSGSRVQVLVDGMPMLSGDQQEVWWNFIPIENVEQVEVIKGASSTLYGSGAINGVINVRTGYATDKPKTSVQVYQGMYMNPRNDSIRWWGVHEQPFFTGAFFNHNRRIAKDFDLVVGGNIHSVKSFRMDSDEHRARMTFKTRYKPKKVPGLVAAINGSVQYQKFGRFFLWQDDVVGAYKPITDSRERYVHFNLDPQISYLSPKGWRHSFKGRYYYVRKILQSTDSSRTNLYYAEYQVQKQFKFGLTTTAGVVGSMNQSQNNLYNDVFVPSYWAGAYLQAEYKYKKFTVQGGIRFEINALPDSLEPGVDGMIETKLEKSNPVLKFGLNYQFHKATFLRASFGQGYRFPSIIERFIDADLVGLKIYANPSLIPERAWNMEIGLKQGFQIGKWRGYADLALFWTEFWDMIEFRFVFKSLSDFGFQSQNLARGRVAGIEVSTMGEGKIGPLPLRFYGGYTFIYPADLTRDTTQRKLGVFMGNFFESMGGVDSLKGSILRYRYRHNFAFDFEVDYWRFTYGMSLSYTGYMDNIDEIFTDIITGVTRFRARHGKGDFVMNARFAYKASEKSTFTFLIKNLTNREYSLRPAMMEAPMNIALQYRYTF